MFSLARFNKKPEGVIGVSRKPRGIVVAYRDKLAPVHFNFCEFLEAKELNKQEELLALEINKHLLQGAPCHYVLPYDDYRLLLLDAPSVSRDEMRSAARWLIKDLIDFPIEEAVIDVFPMPVREGQKPKMSVIVCHLNRLEEICELITVSGLNLTHIGIPELALKNILMGLKEAVKGVALLTLNKRSSNIIIVHDNLLYLSRPINQNPFEGAPLEEEVASETIAVNEDIGEKEEAQLTPIPQEAADNKAGFNVPNIALEIERSLDYYQSQLGQPAPEALFLTPSLDVNTDIQRELSQSLSLPVEELDLNKLLSIKVTLDKDIQSHCVTVLGDLLPLKEHK